MKKMNSEKALPLFVSEDTIQKQIDNDKKHKALMSLNRILGQIEGIKNMVENDRYNVDILTQIRASRAALKSLESKMIEDILRDLINNNNTSSIDKNNNFDELLKMIRKIDIL